MDSDGFDYNALRASTGNNAARGRGGQEKPPGHSVFSFMSQQNQTGQQKRHINLNFATPSRVKSRETQDENLPGADSSAGFKMFSRSHQYVQPEQMSRVSTPGGHSQPHPPQTPSAIRSHNRQHSTMSVETAPSNVDDIDLQEIMSRKMKESSLLKSQLAEERMHNANLKSQLSVLQQTNEGLQSRIQSLEASTKQRVSDFQSVEDRLHHTESNLSETQLELSEAQNQAEKARQDCLNLVREREDELHKVKTELDHAMKKGSENEERVEKVKRLAKKGLEELTGRFEMLQKNFDALLAKYNNSESDLRRAREEVESLRTSSDEQIKKILPMLNDTAPYFAKGVETRNVIEELQNDRNSGQQVIDILRGKLHVVSTQLAESRGRVLELEENERTERKLLAKNSAMLHSLGEKVTAVVDNVSKRDDKEIQALADAAQLEIKLADAQQQVASLTASLDQKDLEISGLVKEKQQLEFTIQDQNRKFVDLGNLSEKFSKAEAMCRQREVDLAKLEESTSALKEKNAELAEALGKSRGTVSELDEKLKKLDAQRIQELTMKEQALENVESSTREIVKLRDNYQAQISLLNTEKENLHQDYASVKEKFGIVTTKMAVLQERFDSQTLTLKLTKEQIGDIQERMLQSETAYAAKLEGLTEKHAGEIALFQEQRHALHEQNATLHTSLSRLEEAVNAKCAAEVAMLQNQNSSLQTSVHRLEEELKTQKEALVATTADFQQRINHQEARNDKLVSTHKDALTDYDGRLENEESRHEKLMEAQENRTLFAEEQARDAMANAAGLRERLKLLELELDKSKVKSGEMVDEAKVQLDDEVKRLQNELALRKTEIRTLLHREESLPQRYKDGELSEQEKAFVASVINMSQVMYEQDVVAKENELRRRDNMINTLQTKVQKLESTVAKCLKEKGKEGGNDTSMVDLNVFMSSSPALRAPGFGTKNQTAQGDRISSRKSSPLTFAKLAADDDEISDSDDDAKLVSAMASPPHRRDGPRTSAAKRDDNTRSSLGKRTRSSPTSPPPPGATQRTAQDEGFRPARRSKAAAAKKIEADLEGKDEDSGPKIKPRRRR